MPPEKEIVVNKFFFYLERTKGGIIAFLLVAFFGIGYYVGTSKTEQIYDKLTRVTIESKLK